MCLCEPSLSLSSLLPSLPPAWLNTFSVPTPSRLCWANLWGQLGGPRGSWRQINAGEGPQVQGPTGNHMELRANLSTLTPTPGSPVTGEGHLPLPEAEGHHGLEEGELSSPPSSPHLLCPLAGIWGPSSSPSMLRGLAKELCPQACQWVQGLWSQIARVQILTLPLPSCELGQVISLLDARNKSG